jgi:hypothetical protein
MLDSCDDIHVALEVNDRLKMIIEIGRDYWRLEIFLKSLNIDENFFAPLLAYGTPYTR